jgi:hypothetical protein
MQYREHTVEQGDCISSIAVKYGLLPETIWDDPQNSELKRLRRNPNALLPNDIVFVREVEQKNHAVSTQKRHRFKRKGIPEKLIIRFMSNNKPRAGEAYKLEVDGRITKGVTDDDGYLHAPIFPNARRARVLFLKTGEKFAFAIGHIDPITEISGVQGRLANLGYFFGLVDGKSSDYLSKAVRNFQTEHLGAEQATGELNEMTRNKIKEIYGD